MAFYKYIPLESWTPASTSQQSPLSNDLTVLTAPNTIVSESLTSSTPRISSYFLSLDIAQRRTNTECGKYLSCRRALNTTESDRMYLEVQTTEALKEFGKLCDEVRKYVQDGRRVERGRAPSTRLPRSPLMKIRVFASVAPDLVSAATMCADLPTPQANSEQNLRRFSEAYTAAENTMMPIEAIRVSAAAMPPTSGSQLIRLSLSIVP
ncbi:hypothetical protein B0H19DRAFT_1260868 [Mycena capillaripes]|nr:hypothetical protein B0H19DRAFT_1260868 [Mycena capillaripes]